MSSGAGLSPGDRRDVVPLSSSLIAQALDRSPDGGVTLVLSKLNLSDVSAGAAEELATIGRVEPEDESVVERITLGSNRLTTLPTEFALLSRLRYLNLKHNNLSTFPDVLAVMPSLDTLDISHNKIRRFPAHPGRLVDLRVFSFSKNKITRLPIYFPQFKRLELLKLDRNPIEWPPRTVLQTEASQGGDKEMKEWIASVMEWVDDNTSPLKIHDDSGYGETLEPDLNVKHERHKAWRFPLRDTGAETPQSHSRSYSVDSQGSASILYDDSLAGVDSGTPSPSKRLYQPIINALESSLGGSQLPDEYMTSPATSEKFDLQQPPSRIATPDARAPPLHLRAASVASDHRAPSSVSGKNSLPDLRSPQWNVLSQSPEQSFTEFLSAQTSESTPVAAVRQASSTSTAPKPSHYAVTPSMAFERNSYFQRLSAMPTSIKLPAPLLCLAETTRSVLFVSSQIYQTIEHYASHAIDEKHSTIFKKLLEPASADMVLLIQALDRFDSTSRKGLPPPPVCRGVAETCRNVITAINKAVYMFAIQLKVAPCDDHRYSRWILMELYASTAEISVAWQNLVPHTTSLKSYLAGRTVQNHSQPPPPLLQAPVFGPSLSNQSRQGDGDYPVPRLRNTDLSSMRTHNARRHAGSFSYRDVELGKVLPSIDEPGSSSSGGSGQFPTVRAPKRQATAPVTAPSLNGSLSLPISQPPVGRLDSRLHSRETSVDQAFRSAPLGPSVPKLKSFDAGRPKTEREGLQNVKHAMESVAKVWDSLEDAITPSDTASKDLVKKGRELSRRLSSPLRAAMDGDKIAESQVNECSQQMLKLLTQIFGLFKNGTLSRSASPALHSHISRLSEAIEGYLRIRNGPSGSHLQSLSSTTPSSHPYSPASGTSLSASTEDNRLGSNLSRARSAQPTPTLKLKTSVNSFNDSPRSALPSASFKIPTINRVTPNSHREGRGELIDPG